MGGQWVAPGQTALLALLDELGLPTFARYREGRALYVDKAGAVHRFDDALPVSAATAAAIESLAKKLDALTAEVDPPRP